MAKEGVGAYRYHGDCQRMLVMQALEIGGEGGDYIKNTMGNGENVWLFLPLFSIITILLHKDRHVRILHVRG